MPTKSAHRRKAHRKIIYCQDKLDNITERMLYAVDLATSQSEIKNDYLKEDVRIQINKLKNYFSDLDRILTEGAGNV